MELSILQLISQTGFTVKIVLAILLSCSVLSWAIIFLKWFDFKQAAKETERFLDLFWNSKSMENIFGETKSFASSPVSNVFRAGYLEFQKISAKNTSEKTNNAILNAGLENVQRALKKSIVSESMRLENKVNILATIASVAPFIGLFGTVWGIMDSFLRLGSGGGGPATLQRVAPGIAEALITTAVGLAAAIPAVVAYNQYIQRMRHLRVEMDSFSTDFTNILKRNFLG